jgi:hypothetical protein
MILIKRIVAKFNRPIKLKLNTKRFASLVFQGVDFFQYIIDFETRFAGSRIILLKSIIYLSASKYCVRFTRQLANRTHESTFGMQNLY